MGNIVDFLAVVPFYVEELFAVDGAFLRVIRVFRLARLTRMRNSKNASEYIEVLNDALMETWRESAAMLSLLLLEVLIFSSLIYAIENGENPDIYSVPAAMWL